MAKGDGFKPDLKLKPGTTALIGFHSPKDRVIRIQNTSDRKKCTTISLGGNLPSVTLKAAESVELKYDAATGNWKHSKEKDPLEELRRESAKVVHVPGLTVRQVRILASCSYEEPNYLGPGRMREDAQELVKEDLLERNPGADFVYRCTELGVAIVQGYARKGWLGSWAKKHWRRIGQKPVLNSNLTFP